MKTLFTLFLSALMLLAVTACASAASPTAEPTLAPADGSIHGVFEGITPCSQLTRPLPQIPADTDCEQMIWKLVLSQDPATGAPTTYQLNSSYGIPKQGTMGLVGGGTAIEMEGNWEVVKGTKDDPEAVVYQLNFEDARPAVSFQKMSEEVLHVLDRDQTLMVGNASFSYSLNRTDNRTFSMLTGSQVKEPPPATRPPIPTQPPGASVVGVFEGRAPCHEIVFELLGMAPYEGCARIKWRLTLYEGGNSNAAGTYVALGTRTIREGKWTIVQGTNNDPDAVVYQLQLESSGLPVSLLKADDNHLFLLDRDLKLMAGDKHLSYTLSRIEGDSK